MTSYILDANGDPPQEVSMEDWPLLAQTQRWNPWSQGRDLVVGEPWNQVSEQVESGPIAHNAPGFVRFRRERWWERRRRLRLTRRAM